MRRDVVTDDTMTMRGTGRLAFHALYWVGAKVGDEFSIETKQGEMVGLARAVEPTANGAKAVFDGAPPVLERGRTYIVRRQPAPAPAERRGGSWSRRRDVSG